MNWLTRIEVYIVRYMDVLMQPGEMVPLLLYSKTGLTYKQLLSKLGSGNGLNVKHGLALTTSYFHL